MFTSLYTTSDDFLTITGNVRYTAFIWWVQALVTIAALYPAYQLAGLEGMAYSRAFIGFMMFFVVSLYVAQKCQFAFRQIVIVVWRPVVAGVTMYIVLINISSLWLLENWLVLIIKIILGAVLYVSFTLILWWLAGKPESGEKTFLGLMMKKVMS